MTKSIIILSGTPKAKSTFHEQSQTIAVTENINLKNTFQDVAKQFGWNGEKTADYHKFTSKFMNLVNDYFDFEVVRLREEINSILERASDTRDTVILLHGVTVKAVEMLKDEYGANYVLLSSRPPEEETRAVHEWADAVLYEDDADFGEQVLKTIKIFTGVA